MKNRREATLAALFAAAIASTVALGELTVNIEREGAEKFPVSIDVAGDPAFAKSLRRNLELTGAFQIRKNASIKVSGRTGAAIRAEGRGKALGFNSSAADSRAARTEARLFANKLMETYAGMKGFANEPIAFVNRKGRVGDVYVCYPDGYDMRKLTNDGSESVGPRWKDARTLFYTGFLGKGGPKVYELDANTGARKLKWSFKGLTTGAAVSPDGRRVAIILSMHGNPELYVLDMAAGTWKRLTHTKNASEGQPVWSPDGRQIAYVSDETRYPQLYVIDVNTKAKHRLTSKGAQNVDPDWSKDGKLAYITKRGGLSQIAVMDPAKGEASVRLVGKPGSWEHPSWAPDSRHVAASRDGAIFSVDTEDDENPPMRIFMNEGNWITPSWRK